MSVQIGIPRLGLTNSEIARVLDAALHHRSRALASDAEIDLWGKKKAMLPDSAVPVLVHEVFCQIDWLEQIIWFNRGHTCDQLWTNTQYAGGIAAGIRGLSPRARTTWIADHGVDSACTMSVSRWGSFDESLIDLLGCFFATAAGAPGGLEHLIATGYINLAHYKILLSRMEDYRKREEFKRAAFSSQARANETEIIRVARALGLNPEPAGIGPVQWYANCPATNHRLMITAGKDEFGCGYCRVKGDASDLKAFAGRKGASLNKFSP